MTAPARTPDQHGNVLAQEGCTRCSCGAKYWEHDVCASCGVPLALALPYATGDGEFHATADAALDHASDVLAATGQVIAVECTPQG